MKNSFHDLRSEKLQFALLTEEEKNIKLSEEEKNIKLTEEESIKLPKSFFSACKISVNDYLKDEKLKQILDEIDISDILNDLNDE